MGKEKATFKWKEINDADSDMLRNMQDPASREGSWSFEKLAARFNAHDHNSLASSEEEALENLLKHSKRTKDFKENYITKDGFVESRRLEFEMLNQLHESLKSRGLWGISMMPS